MLGNNSCGVHAQMAGKAGENVLSMDILLYDGTQMTVGWMDEAQLGAKIAQGGREGNVYEQLKSLRDRYGKLIDEKYPRIPRRVSGSTLDHLLPGEDGRFNIARALVGSEAHAVHYSRSPSTADLQLSEACSAGSWLSGAFMKQEITFHKSLSTNPSGLRELTTS